MVSKLKRLVVGKRRLIVVLMALFVVSVVLYMLLREDEPVAEPVQQETFDPAPLTFIAEPPSGERRIGGTTVGISLFFNTTVDPSTIHVESLPPVPFTITSLADNPDRVILSPNAPWRAGATYTITIKRGIMSEINDRESTEDVILEYRILETEDLPRNYSPYI